MRRKPSTTPISGFERKWLSARRSPITKEPSGLQWDFGSSVVIDEARLYQQTPDAQGTWKWQGSNDGSAWTDLGSSFALGGGTVTSSAMGNNATPYRYYRLLGVSGSTSNNPYVRQFEFHSGLDTANLSYSNAQGSGNRTASITATASSGLVGGDVTQMHAALSTFFEHRWSLRYAQSDPKTASTGK